jgi:hypothetical protein
MKIILLALMIFVISGLPLPAGNEIDYSRMDITFSPPSGWTVDSSLSDKIVFKSLHYTASSMGIIKYKLERDKQIRSAEDLLEAIRGLYDELGFKILSPDDINCLVYDDRAIFMVEFFVEKGENKSPMHRFYKGYIIRRENDGQFLYLIYAESPANEYRAVKSDLMSLIRTFDINMPTEENLFIRNNDARLLFVFIILGLMAFFFVRNRRIQRSRNPLGRDSNNFWRCPSCQRVNHIDHDICQRCGAHRPIQNVR